MKLDQPRTRPIASTPSPRVATGVLARLGWQCVHHSPCSHLPTPRAAHRWCLGPARVVSFSGAVGCAAKTCGCRYTSERMVPQSYIVSQGGAEVRASLTVMLESRGSLDAVGNGLPPGAQCLLSGLHVVPRRHVTSSGVVEHLAQRERWHQFRGHAREGVPQLVL